MTLDYLLTQGAALLSTTTSDISTLWHAGQQYVYNHFGSQGVIAAYVVSGAVGVAVLNKLIRLAMSALIYLVIPAIVLAWLGSLFLPYTFMFLLPITAAGCSLLFLFKA